MSDYPVVGQFIPLGLLQLHGKKRAAYRRLKQARDKHWEEASARSGLMVRVAEIHSGEADESYRLALIAAMPTPTEPRS